MMDINVLFTAQSIHGAFFVYNYFLLITCFDPNQTVLFFRVLFFFFLHFTGHLRIIAVQYKGSTMFLSFSDELKDFMSFFLCYFKTPV